MATAAVLRSQDFLLRPNRFQAEATCSPPLRPRRNVNLDPNPNPQYVRPRRRKRSPVGSPRRGQDRAAATVKFASKNLVMGQVKILKRGEELRPPSPAPPRKIALGFGDEDLVLCSTDRLGPEPETVQKQIRVSNRKVVDGVYAGSAFFTSPPPSSLPFPAFFRKKEKNDAATSDLRRLLRLDML